MMLAYDNSSQPAKASVQTPSKNVTIAAIFWTLPYLMLAPIF